MRFELEAESCECHAQRCHGCAYVALDVVFEIGVVDAAGHDAGPVDAGTVLVGCSGLEEEGVEVILVAFFPGRKMSTGWF